MERRFVFYDPSGKRWTRVRRGLVILAALAAVAAVLLAISFISNPTLPALGLGSVAHVTSRAEVPVIIAGNKAALNLPFRRPPVKYVRSSSPVIHPHTAARVRDDQPLVFGYYVNWDPASMVSLRLNISKLTHLVPEWLVLRNGRGDLSDESDPTVIRIAADAHLPVLAMVSNYRNGWQAGDLHSAITSPESRADLVDNIYNNLVEHQFAGVNVDFEELHARDRAAFVVFMEQLRAKLAPAGLLLTESVPIDDAAYDLKRLAEVDDLIVPMVYDEHYQSSSPGPVASEDWFYSQVQKLAKVLPPSKTVVGFGNYGYDWVIGARGGAEVAFSDVMAAAVQSKAAIGWDRDEENPVLRYTRNGQQHEVWFLDAVTALNQAGDISDAGFRGMALWRLGAEDPGLWNMLAAHKWPDDSFRPWTLDDLKAEKSVSHYGNGDVLRIVEKPHEGKRNVWRESDGDYAETYETYPSYWVIEAFGDPQVAGKKMVALTFDDGPDADYTPRVLDILEQKHAPASFFVVGVNAEEHPELIRREYAEGHLIGNHSYSHPNIALMSDDATARQLSMTQRLIENATGHATTLFRPPYNADSEPQTPEEIAPIFRAQNQGYVTVGERIDPRDWEKDATADQIVDEVLNERDNGHIILLHDAGGDRTATLQALPRIIDELRARGYQIVPLTRLIGKSREAVMPAPSGPERRWARFEGQALDAKGAFKVSIGIVFLWTIFLTAARSLSFGSLAIVQAFRSRKRRFDPGFRPPVSVMIAAFNEEKVIVRTVRSILDNGYPDLEVLVVDDGSTDATLPVVTAAFENDPRVRVFTQPNGGKSSALNHAIAHARHDILVAVDADTIFGKRAIEYLVRHFADPNVGAVSGNARVGNRRTRIARFQSIEYVCGFNLDRRALDLLNAITVVPGAVGAWRKSAVQAFGGFAHDTLAEDADLTLAIRRAGFTIRYEENAVAYTEAPETTRALARQRFRWAFGTLQAAWKHRAATFDPRYGFLGCIAMPSIWIFQVLLAAISPFAELAMIVALVAGNWRMVLVYYAGFFILESLTALLAYALEREKPSDLKLFFLQRLYFRALMQYVLAKSMAYAVRGRLVGWGKLDRTATVQEA